LLAVQVVAQMTAVAVAVLVVTKLLQLAHLQLQLIFH
jgi:hypothetical protein